MCRSVKKTRLKTGIKFKTFFSCFFRSRKEHEAEIVISTCASLLLNLSLEGAKNYTVKKNIT